MITFGCYSQISFGTPRPLFERVLDMTLKPVLTMLYHREDACFTLALSGAEMEWMEANHPEVNMLVSDLVKKGRLSMVSNAYHQGILPLLSPKDRTAQIEKSTSETRLLYSQRPSTYFCYGQVFSPYLINSLSLCDIKRLIIDSPQKKPFIMRELDKSIIVLPIERRSEESVWRFAHKEISFSQLLQGLEEIVKEGDGFLFLNIDQLCMGGISGEEMGSLASMLFDAKPKCLESNDPVDVIRYQCDDWYGLDAEKFGRCCFNKMFVDDESIAYLYYRYLTLAELARANKKNRDLRRQVEKLLLQLSTGSPYLMDANASMVRPSIRQQFFRSLSETELILSREKEFSFPSPYDYDRDGKEELIHLGKNMMALLSPVGGSLSELVYQYSVNLGSAMVPYPPCGTYRARHTGKPGSMLRLFCDVFGDMIQASELELGKGKEYDFSGETYAIDSENSPKNEYTAVWENEKFSIAKRFKFRQNTILMEAKLANKGSHPFQGTYGVTLPLCIPEGKNGLQFNITDDYSKKTSVHQEDEAIIPHVRSARLIGSITATLFASVPFDILKEDARLDARTILDHEEFLLSTLLVPLFSIHLAPHEEKTVTIGLRVEKRTKAETSPLENIHVPR